MKKGNSNIELIMGILLLVLFTASFFTLITTGSNTEKRILEQNEIKANARIAQSYINVKLKQNDKAGKISIKENPDTQKNALVISNVVDGEKYDTWIYFKNGNLLESTTLENVPPVDKEAYKIAKIDGFEIKKEDQKVVSSISYFYNNEPHTVDLIVILRSK